MKSPRSILITGASSGIGEALALAYAGPGRILFLGGRNPERLEAVARAARDRGAEVHIKTADVTDAAAVRAWILDAGLKGPLDLVIANAGIAMRYEAGGVSGESADRIFDVNVQGTLNTVHPAIEAMRERGRGQIALMSSLAGYRGMPSAPAYSASKAAVRHYGLALRGALHGDGIEVSVICPGFVATPMTEKAGYPRPFEMSPEKAAAIIRRRLRKNRGVIAFPRPMRWFVTATSILPESWIDLILRPR